LLCNSCSKIPVTLQNIDYAISAEAPAGICREESKLIGFVNLVDIHNTSAQTKCPAWKSKLTRLNARNRFDWYRCKTSRKVSGKLDRDIWW